MLMKNTYIPLDIIFIRPTAAPRIAENTEPRSYPDHPVEGGRRRECSRSCRPPRQKVLWNRAGDRVAQSLLTADETAAVTFWVARRKRVDVRFPREFGDSAAFSAAVLVTAGRWFESQLPDQ